MRTILAVLSIVAIIGMAVVVGNYSSKYQRERTAHAEATKAEEAVRAQFNAALESIAEIQDSLSAIAPGGSRVRELAQNEVASGAATQSQKERMLGQISNLKQSITDTGNRIRTLETNLKGSQTEVAGLRRIIDNLKRSVAEKETMIASLSEKVDQLSGTVAGLQSDVRDRQQTIAQQADMIENKRQDIATLRYIVGTKEDLVKKGIIVQQGGFIGIGKSPSLSGTFDTSQFTTIDTDQTTEIPVSGREPEVLSGQPRSSYEMAPAGAGKPAEASSWTLRVTDPTAFRQVKYLVVMVK
jgi:hypothetical protein